MQEEQIYNRQTYKPDSNGHYGKSVGLGPFGGRYAPEVLMPALIELQEAFEAAKQSEEFLSALQSSYKHYVGRPTPLLHCKNLSNSLGGAQIFIKNEGLAQTGAHKVNHCVGQILLAKKMNKKRIIAETGAGQHGLATASVCASFGIECTVHMGARDVARQRPNVFWMKRLGAKVNPVHHGGARLKDAVNEAIKDWITNVRDSHFLLGSALGPYPFPEINRYFQTVVGNEIRSQCKELTGGLPDIVIACVGGGSNSLGAFDAFFEEKTVKLVGVEAGGKDAKSAAHAIRFKEGKLGVVEGYKSYWLIDDHGQVKDTASICAGLDYAGIGPLHALLHDTGRVEYTHALDSEVLEAFELLAQKEGILSSLESGHALAHAMKIAPDIDKDKNIVVNLSGRAEKDIFILARGLKDEEFHNFLGEEAKRYDE